MMRCQYLSSMDKIISVQKLKCGPDYIIHVINVVPGLNHGIIKKDPNSTVPGNYEGTTEISNTSAITFLLTMNYRFKHVIQRVSGTIYSYLDSLCSAMEKALVSFTLA